ncbi:hypothetical protein GTW93_05815, partial [Streptomyces sp. SID5789]|nr:hypothetical protein [Streptomyces sp. SID5789]
MADAGFGGRLPTWQNPSFTGAPSPAVLDPSSGDGMLSGAVGTPSRPAAGLEHPARSLPSASPSAAPPVQRMPVAPLRAIPADTPTPTASTAQAPGARSVGPAVPGARAGASAGPA